MKIALTIAGSDSGGGAGIQADLKTFHQFGVFGTSVLVAITAQNTRGVRAVEAVREAMVAAQLTALAEDLPPAALKTGMLAEAPLVRLVSRAIRENGWGPLVVDPVMVSTSGHRLLSTEAEDVIRDSLLPLAAVITPNLDEAAVLTGRVVHDVTTMERAGEILVRFGAAAALVKGGHLSEDTHLRIERRGSQASDAAGCEKGRDVLGRRVGEIRRQHRVAVWRQGAHEPCQCERNGAQGGRGIALRGAQGEIREDTVLIQRTEGREGGLILRRDRTIHSAIS